MAATGAGAAPRLGARPCALTAALAGIAALAFVVRLLPVLLGGGLRGLLGYDDGVYYAAAASLLSGRLPYRDFVLLHPPGLVLALTPFAGLGRLVSDPVGLAVGRLAFMAIGALNATLVTRFGARWGLRAGVVAGLFYACWFPVVYDERTTLLEPLGTTAVLAALLLLVARQSVSPPRAELLAGVALGLSACMKIWGVAPWGAVVLWQLLSRGPRSAVRVAGGGVAVLAVVWGPFLAAAPRRMLDMVVLDQLLRPQPASPRSARLPSMLGVTQVLGHPSRPIAAVGAVVAGLVLLAAAAAAARDRRARLVVVLLVVQMVVLLSGPSYFVHYAAFLAGPLSLVVGIGASRWSGPWSSSRPWLRPALTYATVTVLLGAGARAATTPDGMRFPGAALRAAAPGGGCVVADDDEALIEMDLLSRDLREGCRVDVDVSGITYDVLALRSGGRPVPRRSNAPWQEHLRAYLTSARAYLVIRASGDGLTHHTRMLLARRPALARAGDWVLRRGTGAGR